jgi:hypothetical protein
MAESQKDINSVINVGGALDQWNGVSISGGALVRYDTKPIGGKPSADYDADEREPLTILLRMRITGADQAARDAKIALYARGTKFSCKASPSGSGDMKITGLDATGSDFIVTEAPMEHTRGENSELTMTLTESGPTPA